MGADVNRRSSHDCFQSIGGDTTKALVVIPQVMRICATSNGEQRVQVLIPVEKGLLQEQRQLMQQYFEVKIAFIIARKEIM